MLARLAAGAALTTLCGWLVVACGARSPLEADGRAHTDDCRSFDAFIEPVRVDVFIMLDSSGSMEFETAQGEPKWTAVEEALSDFVFDPASNGLGVSLGFFPLVSPGVPATCVSDADCGELDACVHIGVCLPGPPDEALFCSSVDDCLDAGLPNDECHPLGLCANDTDFLCSADLFLYCPDSSDCLEEGLCRNHYSCSSEAYGMPSPNLLPAQAAAFMAALDVREVDGSTPTLPALQGAMVSATAYREANPQREVVVLLATDGFPTLCDDTIDPDDPLSGIDSLSAVAAAGAELGVRTFIIGVFAPDEEDAAQENLNAVAAAGETDTAFIITLEEDVSGRFLEALVGIRDEATTCAYGLPEALIPMPPSADVGVRIHPAVGTPAWLERRTSEADCGTGDGYYFHPPATETSDPTRIVLCPATCMLWEMTVSPTLEVLVSCGD